MSKPSTNNRSPIPWLQKQAKYRPSRPLRGEYPIAVTILGNQFELNIFGSWRTPAFESAIVTTNCSRPLIEYTIYRRLTDNPQVHFLQEHDATAICADEARTCITGVRLRNRADKSAAEFELKSAFC